MAADALAGVPGVPATSCCISPGPEQPLRGASTRSTIANNQFRGKDLANLLELEARVRGEKVRVPPGPIEEYPRLREIASEG